VPVGEALTAFCISASWAECMLHRLRDLANDFMESALAGPPIDPQRQGWGRMPGLAFLYSCSNTISGAVTPSQQDTKPCRARALALWQAHRTSP